MPGTILNLSPEEVSKSGQPVLLYNASYKHWVFVSNDKNRPDNVVESHPYKHELRNQFVLQPVGGKRYRLYNPEYQQWMFVSNDKDGPDHQVLSHPYSAEDRNSFIFEEAGNNQYLIYNPSYREYLFVSNSIRRGDNLVQSHPYRNEERNKFNLQLLNDIDVTRVDYDLDQGKVTSTLPMVLNSSTITNRTDVTQTSTFQLEESVSETSHFQHTAGCVLSVETRFSTGIPCVAEGHVQVSASANYEYTSGQQRSASKQFSSSFTLACPPHQKATGEASVQKSVLEVPYKMTLQTSDGKLFYAHGVWKGVSHWNLDFKVTSYPL